MAAATQTALDATLPAFGADDWALVGSPRKRDAIARELTARMHGEVGQARVRIRDEGEDAASVLEEIVECFESNLEEFDGHGVGATDTGVRDRIEPLARRAFEAAGLLCAAIEQAHPAGRPDQASHDTPPEPAGGCAAAADADADADAERFEQALARAGFERQNARFTEEHTVAHVLFGGVQATVLAASRQDSRQCYLPASVHDTQLVLKLYNVPDGSAFETVLLERTGNGWVARAAEGGAATLLDEAQALARAFNGGNDAGR